MYSVCVPAVILWGEIEWHFVILGDLGCIVTATVEAKCVLLFLFLIIGQIITKLLPLLKGLCVYLCMCVCAFKNQLTKLLVSKLQRQLELLS